MLPRIFNAWNNEINWKHENKKIAKNENGETVSYLGITELVLAHCNIVNNDY